MRALSARSSWRRQALRTWLCGAPAQLWVVERKSLKLSRVGLQDAILFFSQTCGADVCVAVLHGPALHPSCPWGLACRPSIWLCASCWAPSAGTLGSRKLLIPRTLETRSTRGWYALRPPTLPCTCMGAASRCRRVDPGLRRRQYIPGQFNHSPQRLVVMRGAAWPGVWPQ